FFFFYSPRHPRDLPSFPTRRSSDLAPKDTLPKGEWWQVFHDDTLNGYEQQLLQANQALVAARDRLNQARSLARIATAAYFPQVSTDPNAARQRGSGNRPLNGASAAVIQ